MQYVTKCGYVILGFIIFFFSLICRNGTIDVHEFSSLWKYIQDWKQSFDRYLVFHIHYLNVSLGLEPLNSIYNIKNDFVLTWCHDDYSCEEVYLPSSVQEQNKELLWWICHSGESWLFYIESIMMWWGPSQIHNLLDHMSD